MKKLIVAIAMLFMSACIPAPAETIKTYSANQWIRGVGVSEDGKRRIEIMYQTDALGLVCIYCGLKVLYNGSWVYAIGGEQDNWLYVEWMGEKYFF